MKSKFCFWRDVEGTLANIQDGELEPVARRCYMYKRCSKNFCKIHRKTPVSESYFNKAARPAILLKKSLRHMCFAVNFVKLLKKSFL